MLWKGAAVTSPLPGANIRLTPMIPPTLNSILAVYIYACAFYALMVSFLLPFARNRNNDTDSSHTPLSTVSVYIHCGGGITGAIGGQYSEITIAGSHDSAGGSSDAEGRGPTIPVP